MLKYNSSNIYSVLQYLSNILDIFGYVFVNAWFSAATSSSHFRFKDEQSLDEDADSNSSFLSLNCVDLNKALLCVALHERLAIHPSHFQVSGDCLHLVNS